MLDSSMITPKSILLIRGASSESLEAGSYQQADEIIRKWAAALNREEIDAIRIVVVFIDLFVWTTSVTLHEDNATAENFVQKTIQADWEFNAGVRPNWWPENREANRIWGVHYREDRDNGRAELARMRLERYDLRPVCLTPLPLRNSPSP
jgi:hypothetical protein